MAEITNQPQHGHGHGEHGHRPEENPNTAWERKDVNPFQITAFGIGLLISCVIVAFLMWGLFDFLYSRENAKDTRMAPSIMKERATMKPPEPRLQANPRVDLRDLRESEEGILENYGWLDPDKGTVRIPIDTAIDLVLKKLPSKPSPAGLENSGYKTIPADSNGGRTFERIAQ